MDNIELDRFVNKVRESSDIYSVVSRYISLKQKGNQYWSCCPFHSEKTPSFTVSPEKGFFYCFGCHVGGNVFKFISLIENISYFEAVKLQAERLGIKFPKSNQNKSPEQIAKEKHEKILIKMNTLAKNFFYNCLMKTSYGELGRKYLESRGITVETIETFELGFAPNDWSSLSNAMINKKKFTEEQLIEVGLSKENKNKSGIYDTFRNRIMIPIVDLNDRIVAFGGRVIDDKEEPKYLNSPETAIFSKKNLLFGLNRAIKAIRRFGYVIVVEGYMDVITLFSAGIQNVVASLGTAFTVEQVKLLMRYTRKIYFCYDNDKAGQQATMRALTEIINEDVEAKVINLYGAKDPDEYIKNFGTDKFKQLILTALPTINYQLKYILAHNEHESLEGKLNVINKLKPILNSVDELTWKTEYKRQLALALSLDESVVNSEIKKYLKKNKNLSYQSEKFSLKDNTSKLQAERIVLKRVWNEIDELSYILTIVPEDIFSSAHKEILNYLKKCAEQQKVPNDLNLEGKLSSEAINEISRMLLENSDLQAEEQISSYNDSIRELKLQSLRQRYNVLREEVKEIAIGKANFIDDSDYKIKIKESEEIKKEMDRLKLM